MEKKREKSFDTFHSRQNQRLPYSIYVDRSPIRLHPENYQQQESKHSISHHPHNNHYSSIPYPLHFDQLFHHNNNPSINHPIVSYSQQQHPQPQPPPFKKQQSHSTNQSIQIESGKSINQTTAISSKNLKSNPKLLVNKSKYNNSYNNNREINEYDHGSNDFYPSSTMISMSNQTTLSPIIITTKTSPIISTYSVNDQCVFTDTTYQSSHNQQKNKNNKELRKLNENFPTAIQTSNHKNNNNNMMMSRKMKNDRSNYGSPENYLQNNYQHLLSLPTSYHHPHPHPPPMQRNYFVHQHSTPKPYITSPLTTATTITTTTIHAGFTSTNTTTISQPTIIPQFNRLSRSGVSDEHLYTTIKNQFRQHEFENEGIKSKHRSQQQQQQQQQQEYKYPSAMVGTSHNFHTLASMTLRSSDIDRNPQQYKIENKTKSRNVTGQPLKNIPPNISGQISSGFHSSTSFPMKLSSDVKSSKCVYKMPEESMTSCYQTSTNPRIGGDRHFPLKCDEQKLRTIRSCSKERTKTDQMKLNEMNTFLHHQQRSKSSNKYFHHNSIPNNVDVHQDDVNNDINHNEGLLTNKQHVRTTNMNHNNFPLSHTNESLNSIINGTNANNHHSKLKSDFVMDSSQRPNLSHAVYKPTSINSTFVVTYSPFAATHNYQSFPTTVTSTVPLDNMMTINGLSGKLMTVSTDSLDSVRLLDNDQCPPALPPPQSTTTTTTTFNNNNNNNKNQYLSTRYHSNDFIENGRRSSNHEKLTESFRRFGLQSKPKISNKKKSEESQLAKSSKNNNKKNQNEFKKYLTTDNKSISSTMMNSLLKSSVSNSTHQLLCSLNQLEWEKSSTNFSNIIRTNGGKYPLIIKRKRDSQLFFILEERKTNQMVCIRENCDANLLCIPFTLGTLLRYGQEETLDKATPVTFEIFRDINEIAKNMVKGEKLLVTRSFWSIKRRKVDNKKNDGTTVRKKKEQIIHSTENRFKQIMINEILEIDELRHLPFTKEQQKHFRELVKELPKSKSDSNENLKEEEVFNEKLNEKIFLRCYNIYDHAIYIPIDHLTGEFVILRSHATFNYSSINRLLNNVKQKIFDQLPQSEESTIENLEIELENHYINNPIIIEILWMCGQYSSMIIYLLHLFLKKHFPSHLLQSRTKQLNELDVDYLKKELIIFLDRELTNSFILFDRLIRFLTTTNTTLISKKNDDNYDTNLNENGNIDIEMMKILSGNLIELISFEKYKEYLNNFMSETSMKNSVIDKEIGRIIGILPIFLRYESFDQLIQRTHQISQMINTIRRSDVFGKRLNQIDVQCISILINCIMVTYQTIDTVNEMKGNIEINDARLNTISTSKDTIQLLRHLCEIQHSHFMINASPFQQQFAVRELLSSEKCYLSFGLKQDYTLLIESENDEFYQATSKSLEELMFNSNEVKSNDDYRSGNNNRNNILKKFLRNLRENKSQFLNSIKLLILHEKEEHGIELININENS
ncbi:hypothetical protein SNEBB_007955 [Seison nebaliae]|nr:hypothetical protein SNEBB_007955 [Seison nebaliae]